jgi:methionyl-tRNA formyltransferase
MPKPRIVYVGNDKWSQQLEHIACNLSDRCEVVAVFTEPKAQNFGHYPVVHRGNINKKVDLIRSYEPDFILEYGCHYLFKKPVFDIAPVIGMHPTLLPERRGRAPLNWALRDGLKESGVTMFYLDEGVDSGDIIYQRRFRIEDSDTIEDLVVKVNDILIEMNTDLINNYPDVPRIPQDHSKATYKEKLTPDDGELKQEMSAQEIDRIIRSLASPHFPDPFIVVDGQRLAVEGIADKQPSSGTRIIRLGEVDLLIKGPWKK